MSAAPDGGNQRVWGRRTGCDTHGKPARCFPSLSVRRLQPELRPESLAHAVAHGRL
jgi:hypothetical protein